MFYVSFMYLFIYFVTNNILAYGGWDNCTVKTTEMYWNTLNNVNKVWPQIENWFI